MNDLDHSIRGSGITMPHGINVPHGIFDKNDKRAPWKFDLFNIKIAFFAAYG